MSIATNINAALPYPPLWNRLGLMKSQLIVTIGCTAALLLLAACGSEQRNEAAGTDTTPASAPMASTTDSSTPPSPPMPPIPGEFISDNQISLVVSGMT
jgi:hypothetical protein